MKSPPQEVLRFIDDHDLRDVRAIVWTVMPQERKDARLQKQAEFINLFKEGEVCASSEIFCSSETGI